MAARSKKDTPPLSAERARTLLVIKAESGELCWRISRGNNRAGSKAGALVSGYVVVKVDGFSYRAHRLVWLLHYRQWPEQDLDHINGVRTDNRISNLREASSLENARNRGPGRNPSGKAGVSWDRRSRKWLAKISIEGRRLHLGRFTAVEAAIAVRINAERKFYGEFARSAGGTNG